MAADEGGSGGWCEGSAAAARQESPPPRRPPGGGGKYTDPLTHLTAVPANREKSLSKKKIQTTYPKK